MTCFETVIAEGTPEMLSEVTECMKPRVPASLNTLPVCYTLVDMIVGSGIDLVEIGRIQHSIERYGNRFLNRVYTPAEQAYCQRKRNAAESFAARFAAKEAGAKALGTGIGYGVNWREIEVGRAPGGRPLLRFHGRAAQIAAMLGATNAALSLTHTAELASASVLLENGK